MVTFYFLFFITFSLSYYVRQRTPYFKPYSSKYIFGESFVDKLDEASLNILTESYRIQNKNDVVTCYERELAFNQSWCNRPPCYNLYLSPCRTLCLLL